MHKLVKLNSNGVQHMHISRRLLHTTLYIQPPKLVLTGRFVVKKKNIPGLMYKTRKHNVYLGQAHLG